MSRTKNLNIEYYIKEFMSIDPPQSQLERGIIMKKFIIFLIFIECSILILIHPVLANNNNKILTIGFLGDVSGPLGFWNAPRIVGIKDAIEYINSNYGGIGKRKVKLEWRDHKSNAGLAKKYYKELLIKSDNILLTCGTGEQQLLKPLYEKDKAKIIFTCSTSPGVIYPTGHVFGGAPYYSDQFGVFIDWILEDWKNKKLKGKPKIAFMTYSSGYGRACITKETIEYAKQKDVEVVDTVYIPFVTIDPLTPLLRVKNAGADWIFGQWLWQTVPPYLIANKQHKLGLRFCVNSFGVDQVMITNAKDAAEGLIGISSWAQSIEKSWGNDLARKTIIEKKRRYEDQGSSYYWGWLNMWFARRAFEETLNKMGSWDKVTTKEIMLTLESWQNINIAGMGKFHFTSILRAPLIMRVIQVQNGEWVPVTEWINGKNLAPKEWLKPCHD